MNTKMPEDKPTPPCGPQDELPGGHAARRLEQFLQGRFETQPEGVPPTFLTEDDLKTEFEMADQTIIAEILDRLLAAAQAGEISSVEEARKFVEEFLASPKG